MAQRRVQQPTCSSTIERDQHRRSWLPCCTPSSRCAPTLVCSSWVLKLRLQQTDSRTGLSLAVQRQPKGHAVCSGSQLRVGPQNGAWVLILSVLAVSWICCYKLWEQIRAGMLPTCGGGAKFWANSCQPSDNGRFTPLMALWTSRHLGGLLAVSWGRVQHQLRWALWVGTCGGRAGFWVDSWNPHSGYGVQLWQVQVLDLSRLLLAALWAQYLRDIWENYQHSHEMGPKVIPRTVYFVSSHNMWQVTSQCALPSRQFLQKNTWWLLSLRQQSGPAYFTLQLITGSRGFYCNNWGADSAPKKANSYRAKKRCWPTSKRGSGHHNTNHNFNKGDNVQYIQRKDVEGIHTKSNPHTKTVGLIQATQGCSHIKPAL